MTTVTESKLSLRKGELQFDFLSSGDLRQASGGEFLINQLTGNPVDGAAGNLFLRLHGERGIEAYPLLGVQSASRFRRLGNNRMIWSGRIQSEAAGAEGVRYEVVFTLTGYEVWFWDVRVQGTGVPVDLIYGQDVGLAHPGAVRGNEAYLSQYIDHAVFKDETGNYAVCSRQNQPQGGKFPYLQQGSLTRAAGFSTDGFQFFGLSYKETNLPESLYKANLANEVYQYEFAYTALQSAKSELNGQSRYVFYGLFKDDHPEAISELEFGDVIKQAWREAKADEPSPFTAEDSGEQDRADTDWQPLISRAAAIGEPLQTLSMLPEELDRLFPERKQEEFEGGQLVSFFTETYEHVVLKEKELRVERPHGHILMSGDNARMNPEVITTNTYMYGLFNSQLSVGNTNFNKMMSNARNALNVSKTSGQRLYVEVNGKYRLLTMPSLFEMGFNYTRWYYKTTSETFIITNYTTVDSPEVRLQVSAVSGAAYRYLISNQITMNVNEYEVPFHLKKDAASGVLTFRADESSLSAGVYPNLQYRMSVEGTGYKLGNEELLVQGAEPGSASLVVLELAPASEWTLTMQGLLNGGDLPVQERPAAEEIRRYREFYAGVMNGFRLKSASGQEEELFKVNALAWWYTHNMLVHYSVPHGLEQYGGAAWGTRDVCQGPVEYFMATHNYQQVRDILKTLFAHQYEEDGNWPQWFMFDQYASIQQEESHGDIIVWPLKVVSDYLAATRDFAILDEQIPYTRKHGFEFTEAAPLREHLKKEIGYIREHFLHDTFLSSYGDGDWDDTLQPANAQLKQFMVSSWTVALTYQAVTQLSNILKDTDSEWSGELSRLAEGIKRDFNRYMLDTEVIPGFLYFENPEEAKRMLHPTDEETGIQFRLLPMTRSMISELLSPEQMKAHYELIQEKLLCPDGVRLMNRPAQYVGGVSVHFKRAEQAANFGREIGLQYVHAHIRYVEAMAKIGKAEQAWNGLAVINPIGIRDVVPNAQRRQSNAYFSSSDGEFSTRYEAQERFGELREGKVQVKGGWRIYSSGPGIYMNQLISRVLGIREEGGDLIVDPVLPEGLDGTAFDFEYAGAPVTFVYRIKTGEVSGVTINGTQAAAERIPNPYRPGGLRIKRTEFDQHIREPEGRAMIEILM
ncbi:GH36-type glycosyl hydrolase domain-containing protein [Paenibacillus pinistramenti]|uniref:GH36-type glycosyl hydrolase domain-containing protein n=1 Tax=Paenibacillus pinistramenti TaxID=1768003 RepID=UPI0011096BDF|nr:amylo-alpha-1,6-glucosidase [Paenibacillus pinistramenti]